jgi:predicted transposase YdaD
VETVLVYEFPDLTREEIEAMFTFSDLKQTKVYQEAKAEGLQQEAIAMSQNFMLLSWSS